MKKIITNLSTLIVILFHVLMSPQIVKAETILFEDDFSGGFDKWESVRDNFDMWSIVDNQANVFIDTRSTLAELVPKDSYWNPNWKNIIYELDYTYIQGADKNISFGFKDVLNWYEIHFVGSSYILSHVKNGRVVWDDSGYASIVIGDVNHVSINLNEGDIIVTINGTEVINVTDPTFDNDYGKIGIKAGAGSVYPTHAIYDNIVVKSLDNLITKLAVTIQKQFDPTWGNEEYDSATVWAEDEPGINRWGCLVTSISMVMNFHGIDKMPDGNMVNPSTVNAWLLSQPDGYIGSGLVNWLAITRLTKIINAEYATPKFEYKRIAGVGSDEDLNTASNLVAAKNEIKAGKPAILQIPGHFLVGNGVVEGGKWENDESGAPINDPSNDLDIVDPGYVYEKFSGHNQPLISTRTFEPTFTDLSYIHLSHNQNLSVELKREDNTQINNLQSFEDYIGGFVMDESTAGGGYSEGVSPTTKIHEVEKPESNTYIIEISQENFSPFDLTIFAYNKNGDLSNLSYSGLVGKNKIQLKLIYDNEGNSYLEKIINFNTLANDIGELLEEQKIKKHYVAVELKKYTEFGATSLPENSLRYVDALQQLVEWYSPQITETGKTYLDQRLVEIKGIIEG